MQTGHALIILDIVSSYKVGLRVSLSAIFTATLHLSSLIASSSTTFTAPCAMETTAQNSSGGDIAAELARQAQQDLARRKKLVQARSSLQALVQGAPMTVQQCEHASKVCSCFPPGSFSSSFFFFFFVCLI